MKFKVGDKVKRTKGSYLPKKYGRVGETYEVLEVKPSGCIVVISGEAGADPDLFELVEPRPKTFGEVTDEEKDALLLAHHEGKMIQRYLGSGWRDTPSPISPSWAPDIAYRVKPEPVIKFHEEVVTLENGERVSISYDTIGGKVNYYSVTLGPC